MTTSRAGVVIDALVAVFTADTTLRVFDGPPVTTTPGAKFVVVGGDGADDGNGVDAGSINQDWAGLGAFAKDETGEITCAVWSADGNTSLKDNRDAALVMLGEVEAAIRTDPTLGGVVASGWLNVSSATINQRQNTEGSSVRITFTVGYQARI